jgi:RHS repeat-associated protein
MEQATGSSFYHKDGLGSISDLTNTSGSAVKNYRYRSFGEIYSETGTLEQPFTFTGREYDPESGLYYYRARYYDPRAGRFLTKDPIGFLGGDVNLYRYVGNNPVNFTDPRGMAVFYWHGAIAFAAAWDEDLGLKESIRIGWDAMWRDWGTQKTISAHTNIHGMIGLDLDTGDPQTAAEALAGAQAIIAKEASCGRHGNAMHTVADLEFSHHAGNQWKGWTDPSSLLHLFLDFYPPLDEVIRAYYASRAYLRSQKGR